MYWSKWKKVGRPKNMDNSQIWTEACQILMLFQFYLMKVQFMLWLHGTEYIVQCIQLYSGYSWYSGWIQLHSGYSWYSVYSCTVGTVGTVGTVAQWVQVVQWVQLHSGYSWYSGYIWYSVYSCTVGTGSTVYTVVQWVQLVQLNKCSCYSDLMAAKSYAKIDKNLPINLKTKAKQVKKYTCLGHKKWNWVSQVLPWFKIDPFLKIDATLNNRLDLYVPDIETICKKDTCLLIF